MSKKCTCAFCKRRFDRGEAFVKHAGKHNTYYCNEQEFKLAMERKQKRDEIKKRKQELEAQRKVDSNETSKMP